MKQSITSVISATFLILFSLNAFADKNDDKFNFAKGLYIKKEYEMAAEEFEGLLKKAPKYKSADEAWFWLGQSLYKLEKLDDAEKAFKKLTESFPESGKLPVAYFRLGQISSAKKEGEKAAEYYATVANKWPKNKLAEETLYWSGEELFKIGEFEKAGKTYRDLLKKYPKGKYLSHAGYSLAWSEFNLKNYTLSAKLFSDFLKNFPNHESVNECRLKLAESLYKLKRYNEAIAEYRKLFKAKQEIAREALLGSAWCCYDQKKFKEAATFFGKAAEAFGKSERAANCIFNAGKAYMEINDFARAAGEFYLLTNDFKEHQLAAESNYWYGYCLLKDGKSDKAESILEQALKDGKIQKRKVELLHALAEAKSAQKKFREAAEVYNTVLKNHSENPLADEAGYGRMLALEKAGDLASAEQAGIEFFKLFPKSEVSNLASFALGEYRFRQKKYKLAAEDFNKFLAAGKLQDLGDDANYKLGWCNMNLGRPEAALPYFETIIKDYPESSLAAESSYMAGKAADESGKKDVARARFENCSKTYSNTEYEERAELALTLMDLEAKKYNEALTRTETFIKKHPKSELLPFIFLYQGEILSELNQLDKALVAYQKIKNNDDAGIDAVYGIAWVHRKKGEHKAAAEGFAKVAKTKGAKALDSAYWHARSLEDMKEYLQAAKAYKKFLGQEKDANRKDEMLYRRALCLFRAKKYDEAEKLYLQYLKERENSSFADNALYDLAWLYLDQKKIDEAEKRFAQLLQKSPKGELAQDVEFRLGELAYNKKNFTQAAKFYQDSLARGKADFGDKIYYKLGWSLEKLNKIDEAVKSFINIYKGFPKSELVDEAHYQAGRLLQKQKKYPAAIVEFSKIKSGDFQEKSLFRTAECQRLSGKNQDALKQYASFIKEFPESEFIVQANLGQAHCFRTIEAFQDAIDAYDKVVQATDTVDAASAVMGIGYCHYAKSNFKDAAKAFLKVDILYGYDELKPEALSMLIKSWEKAGNSEKAEKYRKELIKRYPESPFAKSLKSK